MGTPEALERCLREQRECRDYILQGGPDTRGAWQGLEDWVAEEIEIRLQAADKADIMAFR